MCGFDTEIRLLGRDGCLWFSACYRNVTARRLVSKPVGGHCDERKPRARTKIRGNGKREKKTWVIEETWAGVHNKPDRRERGCGVWLIYHLPEETNPSTWARLFASFAIHPSFWAPLLRTGFTARHTIDMTGLRSRPATNRDGRRRLAYSLRPLTKQNCRVNIPRIREPEPLPVGRLPRPAGSRPGSMSGPDRAQLPTPATQK
jgi:hypothetical protein